MGVAVGDRAPLFRLPAVDGRSGEQLEVALEDHLGSRVVLVFYPADNSPVCTEQLGAYTSAISRFDSLDADVLAISPQSPESHARFAEANGGFAFPLLSDEDKSVARAYGNLGLLGLYRRCTLVLDDTGTVSWVHRSIGPGLGYRPVEQLLEAVRQAV